jgi:hypothetical protein
VFFLNTRRSSGRVSLRAERGEGKFKALLATVIIAAAGFAAFKIVPPYVSDYQLKDRMDEIARFSVVNRETEEQVREDVYKVIEDAKIPVKREEIKILTSPKRVTISVDYSVPVDLQVYQTQLHFAHTAENSALF